MPVLTVVTAAKNAAAFLPAAIESIQGQTFGDWDYVVVDDGSSDDTAAIVERYAAQDSRIRLTQLAASIGPYAAANTVMLDASSPYLARLDADDVALPDRFQLQLDELARNPWARANTGAWRPIDEHGAPQGTLMTARTFRNAVLKWTFCLRSAFVHSTLMIDTACFHAIGGYGPERVAEDFRLWARLARDGQLAVFDEPLVNYRVHAKQITAAVDARDQPERLRVRLDHLQHCSDSGWTIDDARDLRYVGRIAPYPVARAMELLARWDAAWRADTTLEPADRRELAAFTGRAYLGHLRTALATRRREVVQEVLSHPLKSASALRGVRASPNTRWR